jgi:ribosomal protein S18 acetylase RimI-like enzyme
MIKYLEGNKHIELVVLFNYLQKIDSDFNPTLTTRVDLEKYAEKLFNKSSIITAYNMNNLVGLICYYSNETRNKIGYLSLVHISKSHRGKGIYGNLFCKMITNLKNLEFIQLRLEVSNQNNHAQDIYRNDGFANNKVLEHGIIMSLDL